MKISEAGIDFIIRHECRVGNLSNHLESYKDIARVWTIGCGATYYEDGSKVRQGDKITLERAYELLEHTLNTMVAPCIASCVKSDINQHQYDALCSFIFNLGCHKFKLSTLLKKINIDPQDPDIRSQFMRWVYAADKPSEGLRNRRQDEADLYFS